VNKDYQFVILYEPPDALWLIRSFTHRRRRDKPDSFIASLTLLMTCATGDDGYCLSAVNRIA